MSTEEDEHFKDGQNYYIPGIPGRLRSLPIPSLSHCQPHRSLSVRLCVAGPDPTAKSVQLASRVLNTVNTRQSGQICGEHHNEGHKGPTFGTALAHFGIEY